MFTFLKRFFPQKQVRVSFDQLPEWLERRTKEAEHSFLERATGAQQEFQHGLATVREKLEALECAELQNPDIPERAKQFMVGNRAEFIRRTTQFLDHLVYPSAIADYLRFFSAFQTEIKAYFLQSNRAISVLSEFFAHEVREVLAALNQAEQVVNLLAQTYHDAKFDEYTKIKAAFEHAQKIITRKQELEHQLGELRNQEMAVQAQRERDNKELGEFSRSKTVLELQQELEQTREAKKAVEQHIRDLFGPLDDALKRLGHHHPAHQKLIERYLANPVEGLTHDYKLDILKLVPLLKTIELKEKKQERAREALSQVTEARLSKLLHDYAHAAKKEEQIRARNEQHPALVRITRLKDSLLRADRTLARLAQEQDPLQKELGKINIDEEKAAVQKLLDPFGITIIADPLHL